MNKILYFCYSSQHFVFFVILMLKQSISRDLDGFFFIPFIHFHVFVGFFDTVLRTVLYCIHTMCLCNVFCSYQPYVFVLKGNKGAVGVSFMFNGTSFGFVNCHLTSGNEKITRYSSLNLNNTSSLDLVVFWLL